MKTVIKLVLIYFLMQILGALISGPFCLLYTYLAGGAFDAGRAGELALVPAMLLGFVFMGLYLWRKHYLTGDRRLYSFLSLPYLAWSMLLGMSSLFLVGILASKLSFLPDWLDQTFDLLQTGWVGILCIAVLGPILEELLFRGAITKILLRKYRPVKAVVISGLVFGIFHLNPAQVVSATFIGILFAWLYYRTKSLVPGILIHILNNSLFVILRMQYPGVEDGSELLGQTAFAAALVLFILLFFISYRKLSSYKLVETNTIEV